MTWEAGIRTAEYSEGSTTTQLLFTYTVSSGDEDTDGIAVVANSLALNGGAIRAGSANATLTHAALHSGDHRVDGIAPTVTVGGEPRTYVPPGRQFNVVFYFSEKVYGITDSEITVTNGLADYVRATSGNATWPKYTRWDVIIVPAAEGPVSVTLEAGAATDAYGNENTAPDSATGSNSGHAGDGGGEPDHLRLCRGRQGGVHGHPLRGQRSHSLCPCPWTRPEISCPAPWRSIRPRTRTIPTNPVTPQEFAFTETPFNLNVTFAAGETSKRIAVLDRGRPQGRGRRHGHTVGSRQARPV